MSRDFGRFVAWLKSLEPRMYPSDPDLVELFWQAHPRFNFFKSLPWGANLLDIGAGNGGLVYWKDWLKPQRADLNLYGIDRNVGEHRDLYAGWEAGDLDAAPPSFPAVKLNAFSRAMRSNTWRPRSRFSDGWLPGRSPAPGSIWSGRAQRH
jgi:hypothetical protein